MPQGKRKRAKKVSQGINGARKTRLSEVQKVLLGRGLLDREDHHRMRQREESVRAAN